MKTIEEAAKNQAANQIRTDREYIQAKKDFKAGVEFAQKWIPVEEELPIEWKHKLSEGVITKDDFNNYSIRFYDYKLKRWSGLPLDPVTHWRPIEFK